MAEAETPWAEIDTAVVPILPIAAFQAAGKGTLSAAAEIRSGVLGTPLAEAEILADPVPHSAGRQPSLNTSPG